MEEAKAEMTDHTPEDAAESAAEEAVEAEVTWTFGSPDTAQTVGSQDMESIYRVLLTTETWPPSDGVSTRIRYPSDTSKSR